MWTFLVRIARLYLDFSQFWVYNLWLFSDYSIFMSQTHRYNILNCENASQNWELKHRNNLFYNFFFCGFCETIFLNKKKTYSKDYHRSCRLYLTYSNQLVLSSFTSYCGIPALTDFLQTVWCILLTKIRRFLSVLWDGKLSLQGKAATERL